MSYTKKAEISCILLKYRNDIPIISHNWNDFALEIMIQEPQYADEVKNKLKNYCKYLLKGIMLVIKWDKGERIIIN